VGGSAVFSLQTTIGLEAEFENLGCSDPCWLLVNCVTFWMFDMLVPPVPPRYAV
jgi:hypothetical protein